MDTVRKNQRKAAKVLKQVLRHGLVSRSLTSPDAILSYAPEQSAPLVFVLPIGERLSTFPGLDATFVETSQTKSLADITSQFLAVLNVDILFEYEEPLEMLRDGQVKLLRALKPIYQHNVLPQAVLIKLQLPRRKDSLSAARYHQLLARCIPPAFPMLLFQCPGEEDLRFLSSLVRLETVKRTWLMIPITDHPDGKRASLGLLW